MRLQLLLLASLLTISSTIVNAGGFLGLNVSRDAAKAINTSSVKTVTGRLVTSRDGEIVFRSPNVNVDIPVTGAGADPLKANARSVFKADTKAQESIGTLPVSAKVVAGAAGSAVELTSNVSNVWTQIKPQLENRAIANQLQQAVNNYEANAIQTLSSSTKGWTPAITAATKLETPPSKPETLAKFQDSVAKQITSPSADTSTNDVTLLAKLYTSADPDQLFGNYGPVAVNWTLDDLKRFGKAVCSVASINYFGQIVGSGFLIGDGLLLTCDHVLALVDLKNATATFPALDEAHPGLTLGFEDNPVLASSTMKAITSKLSNRALRYDFALLKLKDSTKLQGANIQALELSKQNLLNAVVEVVGYPETFSSLIVHDGTMLLPYQLPRKDFNNVLTQRVIHYLNANSGSVPADPAIYNSQLKTAKDLFRQAYGYHDNDPANTTYFYVGRQDEWKDVPTFGVDASTTHGDSGGAVFDKRTLRIIGILRGGNTGSFASGSWFNHDRVIPISEVVDAITQTDSNILTSYNAKVF